MFKNYFKTAVRNLMRNKGFTAINIFGLALGLTICLLIILYVWDELGYDRYNRYADRIYRVDNTIRFGSNENTYAVSPNPMAGAMKSEFPEVEAVTRFRGVYSGIRVKKGMRDIEEDGVIYADSTIFNVFTLPMVDGNPASALRDANSIVITESMAKKYFGRTNVAGQALTIDDTVLYKISGVIRDIPRQSHFRFDFFLAMAARDDSRDGSWLSNNFNTYVLLKPGADPERLQAKLPEFMKRHLKGELQSVLHISYGDFERSGNFWRASLMPLTKIHLESNEIAELGMNGNIQYVYMFSAIALFILIIACINFMNLSTARSASRAREVGVRKVLGSRRKDLIFQFLMESILVTVTGAILAGSGVWALLPLFDSMSGKELVIGSGLMLRLLPVMLVLIVVVGCLSGFYPAFVLSAFRPVEVLKGKITKNFRSGGLRSFLVVFQFVISIFLIIATMVIYNQLRYIQHKDIGYDRDHVLIVQNVRTLGDKARSFRNEVRQMPGVSSVSLTGALPTADYGNNISFFKDRSLDQQGAMAAQHWPVDEGYVPTLGIKLVAGRNFSPALATDSSAVLINETAARRLGFSNPLNQTIYLPGDNTLKTVLAVHIIGVMKDYNFRSLRDNVTPMVLGLDEDRGALSIRINGAARVPEVLAKVRSKWAALSPNEQLNYSFMNEDFEGLYRQELRMGSLSIVFTSLAIIIACLGLFGLAAYAAQQRTKEIGIRKVLGASVATIVTMLSRDFVRLVVIAILIASPLSWLVMRQWLRGFVYRQDVEWWIVAAAGGAAITIALLTISLQAIRAALTNPVESLRSE